MSAAKQGKQASIASFFAKPATKSADPASADGARESGAAVKNAVPTSAAPIADMKPAAAKVASSTAAAGDNAPKRKRLRKAASSDAEAQQAKDDKALEDEDLMDVEAAAPAAAVVSSTPEAPAPAATAAAAADAPAAAEPAEPAADAAPGSAGKPRQLSEAQKAFAAQFGRKSAAASPAKGSGTPGKAGKGKGAAAAAQPDGEKQEQKEEDEAKKAAVQASDKGAEDAGAAPVEPAKPLASIFAKPAPKKAAAAAATGGAKAGAAGKGKAAAAAAKDKSKEEDDVKEAELEDEDVDDEDDVDLEDEIEDEDDEEAPAAKRQKKESGATGSGKAAASKGGKKAAAAAASKMDGVGAGALEAAARHAEVDVSKLVTWKAGDPVPYGFLADVWEEIAEESKRLTIITTLTSAFRAILATTPEDLLPAVYMCVNRVAPAHMGVELGVGESTLIKALADSTGKKEASIKKEYETVGDLGKVAVNARSTQRTMFAPKPLTVRGVFQNFKDIANASGQASQERKKGIMVKMLAASKGNESGYLMRSLQAKLRIGLAEQSVLVSLSHAVTLHRDGASNKDGKLADRLEAAAQAVKMAYSECPSYDVLIPALVAHGTEDLGAHCHFTVGVPVKPMLAKPTTGVSEVLEKFTGTEFTCEYKYDGERAQIHVHKGGKVAIFSRNSENMTTKYPDIVARLPSWLKPGMESCVFDGEAVAWDPVAKKILPFQILSTRARKDVTIADIKVHVCVFVFDCLYLNGRSLLQSPLTERRQAMHDALQEKEGELQFAITKTSKDVEELELFLNEAVDACTEGLIVKTMHDTYEPARRSSHWLKLKKDYLEGVGDTFDVVPVGAFWGKGKRAGLYGAYLLAIYNPDTETYQTISKLGTGFSDAQLQELTDSLKNHVIDAPRNYYQWADTLEPDVWFEPTKVWEVKAADLSISPAHKAAYGLVDPAKGISIRFPRLIRVRDDKGPEDATTAEQVADMYQSQAFAKQNEPAKNADEDW